MNGFGSLFTNEIKGNFDANAVTISEVLSVELSSTTTTFEGSNVCSVKDCNVKAIKASSLCAGITM